MSNKVCVDDVLEALQERARINEIDIMDAEFVRRDGTVLDVSKKDRKQHRFTGLCLIDFVRYGHDGREWLKLYTAAA